ncbi:MAG: QueT transporter family protein [Catonella sp.]|nr:QueT transporter family protein [Catonella sp.]MDY6355946.1 QueT transporter family protein [Catonella sp.]
MRNKKVLYIAQAGIIAAIYVVLTALAAGFDLASGAIQVRFSEVLTVMPYFTPAGIPGVTLGCLIANIVTGSAMPDVVFGTLATLLGALGTYALRKNRWIAPIPPIVANAVIIPFVLRFAYHIEGSLLFFAATVGAGEVITCYIFGQILISALNPVKRHVFAIDN